MRTLVWGKTFIRELKRTLKKNPKLKLVIQDTLRLLQENPFAPKLETVKQNITSYPVHISLFSSNRIMLLPNSSRT